MFVDESGSSHLNHSGRFFILSTLIVSQEDFPILEGYLRLLKRDFLGDDFVNLHATDLYERTYMNYRKLLKPINRTHKFLDSLGSALSSMPYMTGLYFVDKNILRKSLSYTPGKKKNLPNADINLPYQLAACTAFADYASFLNDVKSHGEVIAESRFGNDGDFVGYFDLARRQNLPGGITNAYAKIVHSRINSIRISNKRLVDSGLELADLFAYVVYRHLEGDPNNRVTLSRERLSEIYNIAKSKTYLKANNGNKIGVKKVSMKWYGTDQAV